MTFFRVKRAKNRAWGVETALFFGMVLFFGSGELFAQSYSGVVVPRRIPEYEAEIPSAGSILTPHTTSGLFGPRTTGGYLAPNPRASQFGNSGAVFTPSGGFLGMTANPKNSRVSSYWEQPSDGLPTQVNDDLLRFRAAQNEANAQANEEVGPQQVSATRPTRFPTRPLQPTRSGVVERFPEGGSVAETTPAAEPMRADPSPEQIWMRGPLPTQTTPSGGFSNVTPLERNFGTFGGGEIPAASGPMGADFGSRFIGGTLPDVGANSPSVVPLPIPVRAVDPVASLQEYLEAMLLRSPGVNPLSPIQVIVIGTTATVRGVVPTEANRVEAGRILLTDPRIQRVDNQLTPLPTDPNAPRPAPFDPYLSPEKPISPAPVLKPEPL